MKNKFLKSRRLKAFGLVAGIPVGFLVLSFLVPFYEEHIDKNRVPPPPDFPLHQPDERYTEVRGMN